MWFDTFLYQEMSVGNYQYGKIGEIVSLEFMFSLTHVISNFAILTSMNKLNLILTLLFSCCIAVSKTPVKKVY